MTTTNKDRLNFWANTIVRVAIVLGCLFWASIDARLRFLEQAVRQLQLEVKEISVHLERQAAGGTTFEKAPGWAASRRSTEPGDLDRVENQIEAPGAWRE